MSTFQPVESTSLSKFWFQIVNLHPYSAGGANANDLAAAPKTARRSTLSLLQQWRVERLFVMGLATDMVRRCKLDPSLQAPGFKV